MATIESPRNERRFRVPPRLSAIRQPLSAAFHLSTRATNLSLLLIVVAQVVTGFGSFLVGVPSGRWVVWLHSIGAFSLVLLLIWKYRIILRSLRRHGPGLWALPSLLLLALLLASLLTGLFWSTIGLPEFDGFSGLTVHVGLSIALALVLLPHARAGWPRVRRRDFFRRRALLRDGALLAGGLVLWRGSEAVSAIAGLSGARRRFTGSRLARSFSGNDFPANSWLLDNPDPIDVIGWRLRVHGSVYEPLSLSLDNVPHSETLTATIDCTGGWYSTQHWEGISVARVLQQAGLRSGTRSIVVRSVTGYWRRFPLSAANGMLLATHVGGERLEHLHGAPLRLVIPDRRGFEWVKWVTEVEASTWSPWWKWPLPL